MHTFKVSWFKVQENTTVQISDALNSSNLNASQDQLSKFVFLSNGNFGVFSNHVSYFR